MAPIKAKQVANGLLRKGFTEDETRDHRVFQYHIENRKIGARTMISHSERELDDWHISNMAKQYRLSARNFRLLVECPLSTEKYIEMLEAQGLVDPADRA